MTIATAATTSTSAGQLILGFVFLIAAVAAYFVPLIVAFVRHLPNIMQVALVNFFFGWSVIGWIVALIMAVKPLPAVPPPTRFDGGYGR